MINDTQSCLFTHLVNKLYSKLCKLCHSIQSVDDNPVHDPDSWLQIRTASMYKIGVIGCVSYAQTY